MANQITGRIIEIGQTVQIPSKNGGSSFTKREFILDATTYDLIRESVASMKTLFPQSFQAISVQNLTALIRVMLLLYHLSYKVVRGRTWMENLNVWHPFDVIRQRHVVVYHNLPKLHLHNSLFSSRRHSLPINNCRIFRLLLMRMVIPRTICHFSV